MKAKPRKSKISLPALEKALNLYSGNQTAFAVAVGKTQGHVSQWLRRGRVSAETATALEKATGGKITRAMLRPDLFADRGAAA